MGDEVLERISQMACLQQSEGPALWARQTRGRYTYLRYYRFLMYSSAGLPIWGRATNQALLFVIPVGQLFGQLAHLLALLILKVVAFLKSIHVDVLLDASAYPLSKLLDRQSI